jgi:site-specific recombinase XerD
MTNYFKERDKNNSVRLRELRDRLPEFCEEFFIGIEPQTTSLTRLNYAYDLRIFFDFLLKNVRAFRTYDIFYFTVEDLEKITQTNLESYLEYLNFYEFEGKEYSNGDKGKARKLSTVRTFFKYFYNKGRIGANVASKISMPKIHDKDIVRLEGNEVGKILEAAENGKGMSEHQRKIHLNTRARDVAIVSLLLGTGIRVSECVGLNISDVDFDSDSFTVTRKGGNRAILYFGAEVRQALSVYLEGERKALLSRSKKLAVTDKDALFLSLQIKRISVRAVEDIVKKYAQTAAPLKNISPHKLRSTYGTNLYRATGDIYLVADVLGHRDVNTTKKHYAAIEEDHRKLAAKAVKLRTDDSD